jgi:hypothetical protein
LKENYKQQLGVIFAHASFCFCCCSFEMIKDLENLKGFSKRLQNDSHCLRRGNIKKNTLLTL